MKMGNDPEVQLFPKGVNKPGVNFNYPEMEGALDKRILKKANDLIAKKVRHLLRAQGYRADAAVAIEGGYQIKLNAKNLLSIRLEAVKPEGEGSRVSQIKTLTLDLKTGELVKFRDLFNDDCDYASRLNELIRAALTAREAAAAEQFGGVIKRQEFYLTDDHLVLLLAKPESVTAEWLAPEIEIGYGEVADLVYKNGPLGRLLA